MTLIVDRNTSIRRSPEHEDSSALSPRVLRSLQLQLLGRRADRELKLFHARIPPRTILLPTLLGDDTFLSHPWWTKRDQSQRPNLPDLVLDEAPNVEPYAPVYVDDEMIAQRTADCCRFAVSFPVKVIQLPCTVANALFGPLIPVYIEMAQNIAGWVSPRINASATGALNRTKTFVRNEVLANMKNHLKTALKIAVLTPTLVVGGQAATFLLNEIPRQVVGALIFAAPIVLTCAQLGAIAYCYYNPEPVTELVNKALPKAKTVLKGAATGVGMLARGLLAIAKPVLGGAVKRLCCCCLRPGRAAARVQQFLANNAGRVPLRRRSIQG